jgi:predicted DNA-binding transcriptional regulator YafY
MRADRLLSILLHLQVHRRMTAGDLAERLEVSERTIYRDMEALGMAGIPVVADRGARGGWRLMEDYRTNLTGLNEAEIQALFLAKPMRLLADLQLDKAAEGALLKLLAALPSAHRTGAQDLRQRIHVDVAGWRQTAEPVPFLPLLQEAVWRDRRIRMTYGRTDGTHAEREVDPLGLVAKGSIWYLIAAVEGEPRTYRISRIREALLLDSPCARPADFDLAAYWERSAAQFQAALPRIPAAVRVDPAILPRARSGERYTRVQREDQPDPDGWVPLTILFEDDHSALEWALSFGPQVEIIEPAELRAAVVAAAQGIVARYGAGLDTALPTR